MKSGKWWNENVRCAEEEFDVVKCNVVGWHVVR